MPSPWKLLSLTIALICRPQDHQAQWAIPYILQYIYADSQKEDDTPAADRRRFLKKKYFQRKVQEEVQAYHHRIWPGIVLPASLPTKDAKGDGVGKMPERTVGTSALVATLAWLLGNPAKRNASSARAHHFLKDVIVLAARGGWNIVLRDMQHFQVHDTTVALDGTIQGHLIFGSGGGNRRRVYTQAWDAMLAA